MRYRNFAGLLSAIALASASHATTYSNTQTNTIGYFGNYGSISYGEVFTLGSAQVLKDWTFYAASLYPDPAIGYAGNLAFKVAEWDGSKAVGLDLYSHAGYYAGGAQSLSFGGIDVSLGEGSYIAFMTVAGVSNPVSGLNLSASDSDGGLPGGFRYLDPDPLNPLIPGKVWYASVLPYAHFTANFAPVPEPGSAALLLAGMGLMGILARRRLTRPECILYEASSQEMR